MRVISQHGNVDLPYEQIVVCHAMESVIALFNGEKYVLGEYSSKEKAYKAMEMLREQYKRLETLKLYTKGSHEDIREILTLDELGCTILKTRKLSAFQFPQDDEIEVQRIRSGDLNEFLSKNI